MSNRLHTEALLCDRCGRTWLAMNETEGRGRIKRHRRLFKLHRQRCKETLQLSVEEVDRRTNKLLQKHWTNTVSRKISGGSRDNDIQTSMRYWGEDDNDTYDQAIDINAPSASYFLTVPSENKISENK